MEKSNIQKLLEGTKNERLFADTILTLKNSQGFYSRLYENVMCMGEVWFASLCNEVNEQNFADTLDVVMWLEC
jgi:hypothetical protein